MVLGLCSTPGHVPLTPSDGNNPCSHQSPRPTTHRGSAPDSRLLSSSPECRSQRSPLSSLSSLWLRSEDERLRLECVARYSELLYTWGTGERSERSGYAAGGGVLLVGQAPMHHPAGVLEDGFKHLAKAMGAGGELADLHGGFLVIGFFVLRIQVAVPLGAS